MFWQAFSLPAGRKAGRDMFVTDPAPVTDGDRY
jgi:hypothetical protein